MTTTPGDTPDYATRRTFHQPRVPVWVTNLGIVLLIALLWPVHWLLEAYLNPYFLQILIVIGINIILAVSLNLINGITGQFSLGHAGFMALGAYATGVLLKHYQTEHEASMVLLSLAVLLAGGALAAAAGLVVGIPTLRLRGDYLAIATLGMGIIIQVFIENTDAIGEMDVGGSSGLHGIPIRANFLWVYGSVVACVVCIWRLAHSTKGKAFEAVREDEVAASAMGVAVTYYKVLAFVIGAFFAGIAGGLYAMWFGDLDPASFGFIRSFEIVVMVVLGGSGSITGSILAAALLTYLPEQLRVLKEWTGEDLRMIIYSLLLITTMLMRPTGLMGNRELWWTRRRLSPSDTSLS